VKAEIRLRFLIRPYEITDGAVEELVEIMGKFGFLEELGLSLAR